MSQPRVFTPSADLGAIVPSSPGTRIDKLEAAVRSLSAELRRLERMGLDRPAQECRRQLRYWEFVRAIFALEAHAESPHRGSR